MPIDVTASDPLTAGYKAIVAVLKACTAFNNAVGRFNDWSDGALEKPLQTLNAADAPEVSLLQAAYVIKPFGETAKTAAFTKTYNLAAVGDTLQIAVVNRIEYAIAAAFYKTPLESVTWGGKAFIEDFRISTAADGTGGIRLPGVNTDIARGTDRLSTICSIQLDLYVARSQLPT